MNSITSSSFLFGAGILLFLGWTTAMYLMYGIRLTISHPTSKAFKYYPISALFFGFLAGHWMLPMSDYEKIEELEKQIIELKNKPKIYYSKCLSCGTEFESLKPSQDVISCPQCQISVEDLNKLIESLKNDNSNN